ncbi:hypothetical protein BRARA_G02241 [Brassica rapa]|uniref:DUF620 domain-containing protein n=1 Tax=Brassica campestris TaxID=3711 RepID=A0A397YNE9_BRACM|nr:uncharacterized protein LOC103830665 [Brassica rapa]XP_013651136.2 uncharacterized protein LOC106355801 [Brassica napus]RID54955.1 hypothetical protein BRARA_G02241 [Brassica rapa]CAG7903464.1 unnamed protein product [Brassica rapa]VDD00478.1 unnamed protein product [Brassica rapa]
MKMRKLCPNLDDEDGLETVLEVPVPEEMFTKMGSNATGRWRNMHALMKAHAVVTAVAADMRTPASSSSMSNVNMHMQSKSDNEFVALLKIVGSPLIPFHVPLEFCLSRPINVPSIEASTAKYIVQQYVAACGGPAALNAVKSMYAVGQVRMQGSGMVAGEDEGITATPVRLGKGNFEVGGFVLWQKNPNLWFLELVVSGFKISAGSDGKVAWNQSSTQPSQAHRGPPRPLRRFFQGLDPRCTASLFLDAVCIGEQTINGEDCFVLKVETPADILKAQCSANTEVIHHTVWGYFSQRTGLLVKFGDTKLVRVRSARGKNDGVFWETSMESIIDDYMYVDSVNIAHGGRTLTTLYRYGGAVNHRRRIEEKWRIEEVDFNICGLCLESFLPPSDMNNDR